MNKDSEPKIALFIDYDNIAIGLREAGGQTFEVNLILERILEKGRIIFKRAYADWYLFSDAKRKLHEYGIEMIDIPMRRNIGKNSADIRMVVDALDLCYTKEHIDTFVIGSGDSDFTPLVSKLKENDKNVIGFGLRMSTSNLLANNCDEFIFYEDLVSLPINRPQLPTGLTKRQHDAFTLVLDAVAALIRESKDILWGSLIKDTIRRKRPSFSESQFGYSTFSQLLEDAARHNLIGLIKDPKSGGTPVVTGFGSASEGHASGGKTLASAHPRGGASLLVPPDASRALPSIPSHSVGEDKVPGPLQKGSRPNGAKSAVVEKDVEKGAPTAAQPSAEADSESKVKPAAKAPSRRAPRKPATRVKKSAAAEDASVKEPVEEAAAKSAVSDEPESKPKAATGKLVAKEPAQRPRRRTSTATKERTDTKPAPKEVTKLEPAPIKEKPPVAEKSVPADTSGGKSAETPPAPTLQDAVKPKGKPLKQTAHRRKR